MKDCWKEEEKRFSLQPPVAGGRTEGRYKGLTLGLNLGKWWRASELKLPRDHCEATASIAGLAPAFTHEGTLTAPLNFLHPKLGISASFPGSNRDSLL